MYDFHLGQYTFRTKEPMNSRSSLAGNSLKFCVNVIFEKKKFEVNLYYSSSTHNHGNIGDCNLVPQSTNRFIREKFEISQLVVFNTFIIVFPFNISFFPFIPIISIFHSLIIESYRKNQKISLISR